MDIEQLASVPDTEDAGRSVTLKDVAGKPMLDASGQPLTIVVAGSFSPRYRAAQLKVRNARLTARLEETQTTAETFDAQERAIQAACIVSWPFTSGGKPFAITDRNWTALLAKQPQWEAQVVEVMADHAGFFTAS